jgi:hypothetical protein
MTTEQAHFEMDSDRFEDFVSGLKAKRQMEMD